MPRQYQSSDSDSDPDIIYPASKMPKKHEVVEEEEPSDVEMQADEEDGGNDNESQTADDDQPEPADDEYTVEAIMNHKFDGDDLFFHVKWQDYPNKKDWTWEPEEHLKGGSKEILQEYYKSIGGRPVQKQKESARKRSRQSTGTAASSATPAKSAKKARTSIATNAVESPVGRTKESKGWNPPAGNWEDQIAHIDTIEKTENGLIAYVQWNNGRKSQHDINTVYKKCPQRMLNFYEQHLVFKETGML